MDTFTDIDNTSTDIFTALNVTESVTQQSVTDAVETANNETTGKGYVLVEAERQRIIVIAILMAFTLIGNMTLILVLLCKRSRRIKRVNILLMNLAFGDMAVALFVNSTEILFLAFGDWALGPALCKISVYVQMICLSSATNLLTAMSIDRYQVIVKPMQSLARRPRIFLKIAIAWVLSLIFPIPQLFIFVQYNSGLKHDGTTRRVCGSRGYTAAWQRKFYFTYTTVYILVVPIAVMLYCYAKIIRVVWIRAKNDTGKRASSATQSSIQDTSFIGSIRPPQRLSGSAKDLCSSNENSDFGCGCEGAVKVKVNSKNSNTVRWAKVVKGNKELTQGDSDKTARIQDLTDEDLNTSPRMSIRRSLVTASKRRVLVMTLTVVISFLVCHTPYFFITLVRIYSDYELKLEKARFVSELLVMVHSTLNPILYGIFTLRQYHLKQIVSLLTCSPHPVLPQGQRLRQYSQEKNKLLTSVRSKLGNISSSGATTTTFIGSSNSTHTDPLLGHKRTEVTRHSPFKESPPASSPSASILTRLRGKSRSYLTLNCKRDPITPDGILFTNTNAIHSTNHHRPKSKSVDEPEVESSFSDVPNIIHQCPVLTNSFISKNNGCISSSNTNYKPEVGLIFHGGNDVKCNDVMQDVNIVGVSSFEENSDVSDSRRV